MPSSCSLAARRAAFGGGLVEIRFERARVKQAVKDVVIFVLHSRNLISGGASDAEILPASSSVINKIVALAQALALWLFAGSAMTRSPVAGIDAGPMIRIGSWCWRARRVCPICLRTMAVLLRFAGFRAVSK
jgi:hypothetical protein